MIKNFCVIAALWLFCSSLQAQQMENFLRYEGVELLASVAHPTNTYLGGEFTVYSDMVYITIRYEECTTKVSFRRNGYMLYGMNVTYDSDWFPPFVAAAVIKEVLNEVIQENAARSQLSSYERFIGRSIVDMTISDVVACMMSVSALLY